MAKELPDKIAKLPKWVQNHIRVLSKDLADARSDYQEAIGNKEPSKLSPFLKRYGENDIVIPDGVISFPRHGIDINVNRSDKLIIRAGGLGSESLVIVPIASNCAYVRAIRNPKLEGE